MVPFMETGKNTKRSVTMKLVLPKNNSKKKNDDDSDHDHVNDKNNNRLLITVNVVGSSGPLRFVVNEDDKVSAVIDLSLKLYARGERLPILGSNFKNFMLYASDVGSALDSSKEIGFCGGRNFVLCKKKKNQIPDTTSQIISRQHSGRWKLCVLCLAQ